MALAWLLQVCFTSLVMVPASTTGQSSQRSGGILVTIGKPGRLKAGTPRRVRTNCLTQLIGRMMVIAYSKSPRWTNLRATAGLRPLERQTHCLCDASCGKFWAAWMNASTFLEVG